MNFVGVDRNVLIQNMTPNGFSFELVNSGDNKSFFRNLDPYSVYHIRRADNGHSVVSIGGNTVDTYHLWSYGNATNGTYNQQTNFSSIPGKKGIMYMEGIRIIDRRPEW
ncbi:MAG: hypothetical protein IT569_07200 [Leptospiraceae bacterium]|nr:hypothetical protein [Leptospiraceae bacterium]